MTSVTIILFEITFRQTSLSFKQIFLYRPESINFRWRSRQNSHLIALSCFSRTSVLPSCCVNSLIISQNMQSSWLCRCVCSLHSHQSLPCLFYIQGCEENCDEGDKRAFGPSSRQGCINYMLWVKSVTPPTVSIASSPKGRVVNMHWDAKVISLSPYVKPSVWRTVLFLAMSIRCR